MKKFLLAFYIVIITISCADKKKQESTEKESCSTEKKESKKFEMYEMSEMSMLMEQMYSDNERLKQRIMSGDTIGKFPQHFLNIHKAVMTDKQENDLFFKQHAKQFIASQELIYKEPSKSKENFNASIDECVACHEVKCGGPLVRIKKLYIQ